MAFEITTFETFGRWYASVERDGETVFTTESEEGWTEQDARWTALDWINARAATGGN